MGGGERHFANAGKFGVSAHLLASFPPNGVDVPRLGWGKSRLGSLSEPDFEAPRRLRQRMARVVLASSDSQFAPVLQCEIGAHKGVW